MPGACLFIQSRPLVWAVIADKEKVYGLDDVAKWVALGQDANPPAKLAVIGDPIGHSKSPQMHNPALKAAGIDGSYIRLHVPAGRVAEALMLLRRAGFVGVNVTIPHKFEALEAVDEVDSLARTLGAVNTVALLPDRLVGYNSDGPGFLRAVEQGFGRTVEGMSIMILGAGGGAGRAVAVQCALAGCRRLMLVNRTPAKVAPLKSEIHGLAPHCDVELVKWSRADLAPILKDQALNLVVNASPVGMKEGDPCPLPAYAMQPTQLFFDMVYRTGSQPTSLGADALAIGAPYVDGTLLLLHQGAISFEHWFHIPAPIEAMRAGLQEALGHD